MKKAIVFLALLYCILPNVFAQDLTPLAEACPYEVVPFNTPQPPFDGTVSYSWDFCTGDLLQTPQASVASTGINDTQVQSEVHRPESIEVVFDGENWYGFIPNRGNGFLIRADFGNSLDNIPTYKSLGNLNNTLFAPRGIKVFKQGNNWIGLVTNITITAGQPRLVKIDFGANLNNNTPTATSIAEGLPIDAGQGMEIIKEGGKYYVLVHNVLLGSPNRRRLTLLDFGSTVTDNCSLVRTINTTLPSFQGELSLIRQGDSLYGVWAGGGDAVNRLVVLNFGTSITNTPTITNFTSLFPNTIPIDNVATPVTLFGVELFLDGKNYIAIVTSDLGPVFRVNFGNSMTNTPTVTNMGNFGMVGKARRTSLATTCSAMVKHNSEYYLFVINRLLDPLETNELIKLKFPNLCNAEPSVSYSQNTETIFQQAGVQNVNLTVFDGLGQPLYTYADDILIKQAMIGEFSYDGQCFGQPTTFNNLSRGLESNVSSWEWKFGDGQTSGNREATHTYTQPGKYTVSLKVNNNTNCTNTIEKQIRISSRPVVDFRVKSIDCATNTVIFEDLSDLTAFDKSLGGEIRSRTWFFGDGTRWIASPYTATTYSKTYTTANVFTVTLVVTDETGCSSATSKQISILPTAKPIANFEYSSPCLGVPIKFTDKSSLPVGSIGELTGWQWTFYAPDGVTVMATSNQKEPVYAFSAMGTYKVKMSVRNTLGCTSEKIANITMLASPNTLFQVSALTGPAPLTVKFTNATAGAVSYLWNFGTGEYSTLASPTYTFQNEGVYTVTFQAKNALGCGKIVTQTIIVEQPTAEEPPLPARYEFKIYPNPTAHNLFVEFEGLPIESAYNFTDMAGKTVLQGNLKERKNTIDMKNLPAGVYILHLREGNRFWTRKIVRI
jgi:PKD repeat protein